MNSWSLAREVTHAPELLLQLGCWARFLPVLRPLPSGWRSRSSTEVSRQFRRPAHELDGRDSCLPLVVVDHLLRRAQQLGELCSRPSARKCWRPGQAPAEVVRARLWKGSSGSDHRGRRGAGAFRDLSDWACGVSLRKK